MCLNVYLITGRSHYLINHAPDIWVRPVINLKNPLADSNLIKMSTSQAITKNIHGTFGSIYPTEFLNYFDNPFYKLFL